MLLLGCLVVLAASGETRHLKKVESDPAPPGSYSFGFSDLVEENGVPGWSPLKLGGEFRALKSFYNDLSSRELPDGDAEEATPTSDVPPMARPTAPPADLENCEIDLLKHIQQQIPSAGGLRQLLEKEHVVAIARLACTELWRREVLERGVQARRGEFGEKPVRAEFVDVKDDKWKAARSDSWFGGLGDGIMSYMMGMMDGTGVAEAQAGVAEAPVGVVSPRMGGDQSGKGKDAGGGGGRLQATVDDGKEMMEMLWNMYRIGRRILSFVV